MGKIFIILFFFYKLFGIDILIRDDDNFGIDILIRDNDIFF